MDTPLIPDELSNEERVSGVWWKQIIAGGGAGAGERGRGGRGGRIHVYCIFSESTVSTFPQFLVLLLLLWTGSRYSSRLNQ